MRYSIGRLANTILNLINRRLIRLDDKRLIEVDYPYFPKPRSWAETTGIKHITKQLITRESAFAEILRLFSCYKDKFEAIPVKNIEDDINPSWCNDYLPGLDAATIYGLLATRNPSVYFEIGSGNSTKFARRAIEDNGLRTKIISLDPQPRVEIDSISDEIIRSSCEEVPISFFESLPSNMIFFLDGSHRSFQNSDVTVFFTEIVPSLPIGSIWGIHDIELPYDYPAEVAGRYYNEQYLLLTYLLGGGGKDSILLPNAYISRHTRLSQIVTNMIFTNNKFNDVEKHGSCFWMLRDRQAKVALV